MIPPVKQEALPMVAIAPTPATSHSKAQTAEQQAADNQTEVALEITRQPPETFYKDQYGRKATFDMVVKRSANCCAQCEGQRLLSVQLLYENGKAVEKQGVLHVASGLCLNQNKESTIAIRIAEVSKNHLNQRFRLEIAVPPCPGVCALKTSVVSNPVLVMSKTKKRHVKRDGETESPAKMKKAKSVQSIAEGTPTKQPDSSIDTLSAYSTLTGRVAVAIAGMGESGPPISASEIAPFALDTPNLCLWANAAFDLLRKLQWQRLPAPSTDMPGANLDEILTQALSRAYKCPSCHEIYGDIPSHREDCDLKLLLEQGQTASPTNAAQAEDGEYTESHPLPWSSDKPNFSWTEPMRAGMYSGGCVTPKAQGSPCNLTQDLLQHDSPTELRFMPNLYALPEEMLRELEITVTEWKKSPSIIQTRRPSEGNTDESLTRLKNAAKGLQKLRWFCQVCQKQCRDENGFKCHTTSEAHQRQMLIVAADPDKFMSGYSEMFEEAFLENLRRRHGTKRMRATHVYNEYIADKLHVHMNATQWTTLGSFVQYLGRTGKCVVDETEKGWHLQYIDRDPRAIARQEELEKKKKAELDHEERNRAFIAKQLKIASRQESGETEQRPTKLQRTDSGEKIKISLTAKAGGKEGTSSGATKVSVFTNTSTVFGGDKSDNGRHESDRKLSKRNAVDAIMEEEERQKREQSRRMEEESKRQRKENWITTGIIVKVVNKKVGDGHYYKSKGVIKDVEDKFCATVELLDSGDVLKLDQDDLETVIPKPGRKVKIVNGIGRGSIAKLLDISVEDFCARIRIDSGSRRGEILNRVEYEDISRLADD
ncbi:hypothetical protein PHYBOEH_006518 [Phytophthora boehmeriae]|uniref:DNA/RNA-binding protein Kin17 WH-like domain-containing protein n=1 Tax=Phytophthora boehmeriae TaxID=109152 RepID=A0A8T1WDZ5_9STRA|nr:hypothetical protein PHYBOEH_006518 [Phytophthora boehmeriae]